MGLKDTVQGLLRANGVTDASVTPFAVRGRGRTPKGYTRDTVVVRQPSPRGTKTSTVNAMANGDLISRPGYPHRSNVFNKTRAAVAHAHDKVVNGRRVAGRDDIHGTSRGMFGKPPSTFGFPRNPLSDNNLLRASRASVDPININITAAQGIFKSFGHSERLASVFNRNSTDLSSMRLSAQHIQSWARDYRVAASKPIGRAALSENAKWQRALLRDSATRAETLAHDAGKLSKTASKFSANASALEKAAVKASVKAESMAKASSIASEKAAKAVGTKAEVAARQAAIEAEKAAALAAQEAEKAALLAAQGGELAVLKAAEAAETMIKATAIAAETAARATAYTAAAALGAALGGGS